MPAPDSYNEISRLKAVESYRSLKQWEERSIFRRKISSIRKQFNVKGVCISLITKHKTIIKYESLLNMTEIARPISIDSHAVLSQGYFLLLDAKSDWRTGNNPLVNSMPYIRFYCGVPLCTSKNEVIGILSIFESYPRAKFSSMELDKLECFRDEIMEILNTPVDQLRSIYKSSNDSLNASTNPVQLELNELSLKLGRATSRGTSMTVFEKDGTGGPYIQNYNFKILSNILTESQQGLHNNKSIREKLIKMGSLKKGANLLSKIISATYKVDFVYILEIRVAESYKIDNKYFPANDNKIDAENFRHANKLIKDNFIETDFMTRIIGSYGSNYSHLNFENLIHHKSFQSEFGISYKNLSNDTLYNNGSIIPFYRHNSKLIRQKGVKSRSPTKPNNNKGMVNLYLRSGGFLIGLFNQDINKGLDQECLSQIYANVSTLRKIYISG